MLHTTHPQAPRVRGRPAFQPDGPRLKALRRDVTQKALALRIRTSGDPAGLNFSHMTVSRAERGLPIEIKSAELIATGLDTTPAAFARAKNP